MLKELETKLSSPRERLSGVYLTERESSSWERTERREEEVPHDSTDWFPSVLTIGAAVLATVSVGTGAVAAAVALGMLGLFVVTTAGLSRAPGARSRAHELHPIENADGEEIVMMRKIADVCRAIGEDRKACQELERNRKFLENCVADFGVFCRDHIDSLLSSELLEGEFRILLNILRGTHSPGAAANTRVPLAVLLDEEEYIHDMRVSILMELLRHSTTNQEVSSITQRILHKLREGPNDEEIKTMIMNFIEAKFAEACK